MFEPINPERYNIYELNRQLDITKSRVFMGTNAAFMSSLMCSMQMIWTKQVRTAMTNGEFIWWNPDDFLGISQEFRDATILHEIWHKAQMHMLRGVGKHQLGWNIACDIWINNKLIEQGFNLEGSPLWVVDRDYVGWVEEDIYTDYIEKNPLLEEGEMSIGGPGCGDLAINDMQVKDINMPDLPPVDPSKIISDIVQAVTESELAGEWDNLDPTMRGIKTNLQQFMKPIITWDVKLHRWLKEKLKKVTSWRRPNRRSQSIFLPSRIKNKGALDHIVCFFDVSGSVSDTDAIRAGSEFKHVWDKYRPKKMTIVQFDSEITHVHEMKRGDKMHEINIVGRKGTDLSVVRQWILEHNVSLAIIFSDLFCYPMEALPEEEMIPIFWITIGNKGAKVPHGDMIHVKA